MTAACHPIPASAAHAYFEQAKHAFCDDRPNETPAHAAARTKRMVHTVLGFEPRDGLEYMIATLIEGQYQILMHAMGAALKDETAAATPRALSGIAALSRVFVSLLRESRTAQKRPLEEDSAPAQTPPATQTEPAQPAAPTPPPAKPTPDRTNVLTLADFPPGPSPEDGARLAKSLAAFQKAHAETKATLAETDRKLSRTATGR